MFHRHRNTKLVYLSLKGSFLELTKVNHWDKNRDEAKCERYSLILSPSYKTNRSQEQLDVLKNSIYFSAISLQDSELSVCKTALNSGKFYLSQGREEFGGFLFYDDQNQIVGMVWIIYGFGLIEFVRDGYPVEKALSLMKIAGKE